MNYRDAIRKLIILDCKELPRRGGGSHRKWYNPRIGRATILPDWGNRDLKIGTLKAAIKQLGIAWDAFSRHRYFTGSGGIAMIQRLEHIFLL